MTVTVNDTLPPDLRATDSAPADTCIHGVSKQRECAQCDEVFYRIEKKVLADSAALQCTGCENVTKPICGHFTEQDDGEGRVSHYCAACGHSDECHEPVRAAHSADAAREE